MSPSDEKPPVAGTPPFANASDTSSAAPLKNPLHQMYGQANAMSAAANEPAAPQAGSAGVVAQQPALDAAMQGHTASQAPDSADEQVWIEKTKAALAQTQNDPHRRVQVLQELRASYQATRFNKHTDGTMSS